MTNLSEKLYKLRDAQVSTQVEIEQSEQKLQKIVDARSWGLSQDEIWGSFNSAEVEKWLAGQDLRKETMRVKKLAKAKSEWRQARRMKFLDQIFLKYNAKKSPSELHTYVGECVAEDAMADIKDVDQKAGAAPKQQAGASSSSSSSSSK